MIPNQTIEMGNSPQLDRTLDEKLNARFNSGQPDEIPVVMRDGSSPRAKKLDTQDHGSVRPEEELSHESQVPLIGKSEEGLSQIPVSSPKPNQVSVMTPPSWDVPTVDLGGTCLKGHGLKISRGEKPSVGTLTQCSTCKMKIATQDVAYYCDNCRYYQCRTCYLISRQMLKPTYDLPMGSFDQVKGVHIGYYRCMSSFVGGCDPILSKCERGQDAEGFGAEHSKAGGYTDEENGIFFCTPCMLKWSQVKLDPGTSFTMKDKLRERALAPQPIPALPTAEEDNTIIGLSILKPKEAREEVESRFYKKFIQPNCFEEVCKIQDYALTDYENPQLLDGFKSSQEAKDSDCLVNQSMSFVQGSNNQYWGIIATTCHAEDKEKGVGFVTRRLLVFGKDSIKIKKNILIEQIQTESWRDKQYHQAEPSYWRFEKSIFYWKRSYQEQKSTLALMKLDLKSLEENSVDGYTIEDPSHEIYAIRFGKQIGHLFYAYYKQGSEIKREVYFTDETASLEKVKDLANESGVSEVLLLDSHHGTAVWKTMQKKATVEELKERAYSDKVITKAQVERQVGKPGEVNETELDTLKAQNILLQKGKEQINISIFSLSNLKEPIRTLKLPNLNCEVRGFFVKAEMENDGSKKEDLRQVLLFGAGRYVVQQDYFPNDSSRNVAAPGEYKTSEMYHELDSLTRAYQHHNNKWSTIGNQNDVQQLEITTKMPGEEEEKTFTQFYVIGHSSKILLYPSYDPQLGTDSSGKPMKLADAGPSRNEVQNTLIYNKIQKLVANELSSKPEHYRVLNNSTKNDLNFQLRMVEHAPSLKCLDGFFKTQKVTEAIKKDPKSGLTWLISDLFEESFFMTFRPTVNYRAPHYLHRVTVQTQGEMVNLIKPRQDFSSLVVNPRRTEAILNRYGSSIADSSEGRFSSHQQNLMQFGLEKGFGKEFNLQSSAHSNVFFNSSEVFSITDNQVKSVFKHENPSEGNCLIESVRRPGVFSLLNLASDDIKPGFQGSNAEDEGKTEAKWNFALLTYSRSKAKHIFALQVTSAYQKYHFFLVLANDEVAALENRKDKFLLHPQAKIFTIRYKEASKEEQKFTFQHYTMGDFLKFIILDQSVARSIYLGKELKFEGLSDVRNTSSYLPLLFRDMISNTALLFIGFDAPKPSLLYSCATPMREMSKQSLSSYPIFLCRSSEPVRSSRDPSITCRKFLVSSQMPAPFPYCCIREYSLLENERSGEAELKLTGMREILSRAKSIMDGIRTHILLPYHGENGTIEGAQLCVQPSGSKPAVSFVLYDEQFNRQQFQYKSEQVKFGYQELFIEQHFGEVRHLLLSTCLRSRFIYSKFFDEYETLSLLESKISGMLCMQPFKLSNLFLGSQSAPMFRAFECLGGKKECDFHLKEPETIVQAFSEASLSSSSLLGSLWANKTPSKYEEEARLLSVTTLPSLAFSKMSTDFNFVSPLERAFQLHAYKTTNILLEFMLTSDQAWSYKPLMMRILPLAMQHSQVSSFASFLEIPEADEESCSLETRLQSAELPLFSEAPCTMTRIKDYYDINNPSKELIRAIKSALSGGREVKPIAASASIQQAIEDQLKKTETSESQAKSFALEHICFDLRQLILGEKIRRNEVFECDSYYLSNFINGAASGEFFDQSSIRRIIDVQFATSKMIASFAFLFYFLLFVVPFVSLIFKEDIELPCYIIGFVPQVFFLVVELVQLQQQGWDYIRKDLWNLFDFVQFFNFLGLFLLSRGVTFGLEDDGLKFTIILGKLLLLFEAFVKVLYFIRIFESFGFLVQMVLLTIKEVIPFTVFLFMWIALFALSYKVLLLHIENDPNAGDEVDYAYLNEPVRFIIQSYRNSIGDINAPDYGEWAPGGSDDESKGLKYTMIYLIWFVWFVNQFVNLIILLNFLIAVISQTYEKVISQQQTHNYQHKSMMNAEIYQMGRLFGLTKPYKILAISMSKEEEEAESNEWEGLIKTLKKDIHASITPISKQTKDLNGKVEKMASDMGSLQSQMEEVLSILKENNNNK